MEPSFDIDEGLCTCDVIYHYDPMRSPVVSEHAEERETQALDNKPSKSQELQFG